MTASKQALISVSDKTGALELARGLAGLGFGILSTGGTARMLTEAGVRVTEIGRVRAAPPGPRRAAGAR